MEPSPGLGLACVVVISDLVGVQEREIHRTQKSEAALEEARAFLETQELLLFTNYRTRPSEMLQNVVFLHFGTSCAFMNGFCMFL